MVAITPAIAAPTARIGAAAAIIDAANPPVATFAAPSATVPAETMPLTTVIAAPPAVVATVAAICAIFVAFNAVLNRLNAPVIRPTTVPTPDIIAPVIMNNGPATASAAIIPTMVAVNCGLATAQSVTLLITGIMLSTSGISTSLMNGVIAWIASVSTLPCNEFILPENVSLLAAARSDALAWSPIASVMLPMPPVASSDINADCP